MASSRSPRVSRRTPRVSRARPSAYRPYRRLAQFYGDLLPGIDAMNRHARERILGAFLRRPRRILELGCGNGATAVELAQAGHEVVALDYSPSFVRAARERARAAGATAGSLRLRVARGDMRSFRFDRRFDLVLCEFSALNNIDRREDLGRVLRCVARALGPGGRFLFDVDTPLAYAKQTGAQWIDHAEFKLVMHWQLARDGLGVPLVLEWLLPAGRRGLYRHERETFVHVTWTEAELRGALRRAGFASVRRFDGMDVRPKEFCSERGTDLYFLARAP